MQKWVRLYLFMALFAGFMLFDHAAFAQQKDEIILGYLRHTNSDGTAEATPVVRKTGDSPTDQIVVGKQFVTELDPLVQSTVVANKLILTKFDASKPFMTLDLEEIVLNR